jgi:uncharacterized protein with HEPN domain
MSVYRSSGDGPDDEARIRHMLDASRRAMELSRGKTVAELDSDSETALALTRLLEILGEAAGRVTPEIRERHPGVPWRDIAATRNRVIHRYFDVDMGIVEAIVGNDLPTLTGQLEDILKEMGEETGRSSDG